MSSTHQPARTVVLVLTAARLAQSKLPEFLSHMSKNKAAPEIRSGLLFFYGFFSRLAGTGLGVDHLNVNTGNAVRRVAENDGEGD